MHPSSASSTASGKADPDFGKLTVPGNCKGQIAAAEPLHVRPVLYTALYADQRIIWSTNQFLDTTFHFREVVARLEGFHSAMLIAM